ncbi:MAG: glycosyltransferase family 4 protein [Kofleriaceae bacterium]
MKSPGAAIRLAHVCSSDLGILPLLPFCEPLVARGWQITMITPDGPNVARALDAGMSWLPLLLQRRLHLASDLRGAVQLGRYFREHRYDIVHTHNIKVGQIGRVVAAATRMPRIVHTVHGMAYSRDTPPVKRLLHAVLERIASIGCDLVFTQSQEDRDMLLASRAVREDRLVVIGNGIRLARFDASAPAARTQRAAVRAELGLADDDVLFLSAGRLIREKGFPELFEATVRAHREDPRIRLAIAGPTDEQRADALAPEVLEQARRDGILLLGRRDDMTALYAASDVVTLPSWHEGMPRVLMEGAAMGKPLLTTDVCGCREVVVPPRNGLIVPVRDAAALATAMRSLAANEPLRAELGRANAIEARERFDIERSVALVNSHYDRLLVEVA